MTPDVRVTERVGDCRDAIADFGLSVRSCCGSCHTDADEFGYELMERECGGKTYRVCCAVVDLLPERFPVPEEGGR